MRLAYLGLRFIWLIGVLYCLNLLYFLVRILQVVLLSFIAAFVKPAYFKLALGFFKLALGSIFKEKLATLWQKFVLGSFDLALVFAFAF